MQDSSYLTIAGVYRYMSNPVGYVSLSDDIDVPNARVCFLVSISNEIDDWDALIFDDSIHQYFNGIGFPACKQILLWEDEIRSLITQWISEGMPL